MPPSRSMHGAGVLSESMLSRPRLGSTAPRVRDFHDEDLDGVVRLFDEARAGDTPPVYALSEVIASCQKDHAVVALHGDTVIGAAVGRAAHAQGWLVFLSAPHAVEHRAVAPALLDALQRRMTPIGLGKLSILVPDGDGLLPVLAENGFQVQRQLRYCERPMPLHSRELALLREIGGRYVPAGAWDRLSGMVHEKAVLESRLIVPLANPAMAERYGVVPPRAVMLFGPPGTGKTTFARAVASRLGWPFVEVFPSRLGDQGSSAASDLRSAFERVADLEHAVVFVDEVEEIATHRRGDPPSATLGLTNELLKLIPQFREQPGRLLICATNFIRSLDNAFLRHGRFDHVFPIGLPDAEARSSMWSRLIPPEVLAEIDVRSLVLRSDGLTPADIEFAARRASQEALTRALARGSAGETDATGLSSEDYLRALGSTRATVSIETARQFEDDIAAFARI